MLNPRELRAIAKANGEKPIECLVPGCRGKSWKFRAAAEYICGRHFRLVDPAWRRAHLNTLKGIHNAESAGYTAEAMRDKSAKIWTRIKAAVLERALGAPEAPDEPIEDLKPRDVRAVKHKPDF